MRDYPRRMRYYKERFMTDYVCDKGRETCRLVVKRLIRALPAGPAAAAARLLNDIKILLRGYATINPIIE